MQVLLKDGEASLLGSRAAQDFRLGATGERCRSARRGGQ